MDVGLKPDLRSGVLPLQAGLQPESDKAKNHP